MISLSGVCPWDFLSTMTWVADTLLYCTSCLLNFYFFHACEQCCRSHHWDISHRLYTEWLSEIDVDLSHMCEYLIQYFECSVQKFLHQQHKSICISIYTHEDLVCYRHSYPVVWQATCTSAASEITHWRILLEMCFEGFDYFIYFLLEVEGARWQ